VHKTAAGATSWLDSDNWSYLTAFRRCHGWQRSILEGTAVAIFLLRSVNGGENHQPVFASSTPTNDGGSCSRLTEKTILVALGVVRGEDRQRGLVGIWRSAAQCHAPHSVDSAMTILSHLPGPYDGDAGSAVSLVRRTTISPQRRQVPAN